jgi:hypothetical protein
MHGTPRTGIDGLVYGIYEGMTIEGLRDKVTFVIRTVTLTGKIKAGVTNAFQDCCPFGGFE